MYVYLAFNHLVNEVLVSYLTPLQHSHPMIFWLRDLLVRRSLKSSTLVMHSSLGPKEGEYQCAPLIEIRLTYLPKPGVGGTVC